MAQRAQSMAPVSGRFAETLVDNETLAVTTQVRLQRVSQSLSLGLGNWGSA